MLGGPHAWTRSLPSGPAMAELVRQRYGLAVTDAVLLRSLANDVYRVDGPDGVFALKVYGTGRFTPDEVRWEQQLAHHLARSGVPVATGVPLTDGDTVSVLDAPEGERVVALTGWLPGAKPVPPWTDDLYRSYGAALAHLHVATDDFTSELSRQPSRPGRKIEVIEALAGSPGDQALVRSASTAAAAEVAALARRGLRWGIRHGDPSLDNLHVDGDRLRFYDFDLAGAGWQVEDLAGALSTDFADVFLAGYTAVRPLSEADLAAVPWLRIEMTVGNLHFHLIDKPRFAGTESRDEGWAEDNLQSLRDLMRELGH